MIKFVEEGEQYYFDPEGPETDYTGDTKVLIQNLAHIESLAYQIEAPEDGIEDTDEGWSTPERRVYDPQKAEDIIRATIQRVDGVSEQ